MAEQTIPKGACGYCGREMTRSGMARHLDACPRRTEVVAQADAKRRIPAKPRKRSEQRRPPPPGTQVHLQVQDAEIGDYWVHLEVDGATTLATLDDYLRVLWLDCCGHMSQFSAGGRWGDEIPMNRVVERVFKPGVELIHVYDFGTSSFTRLRAVGRRVGNPTTPHPIVLMARNAPPIYPCAECDAPAVAQCMECLIEEDEPGLLCEAHAASHPHREYGEPRPLANSPRVGMCGYEGPAEPPY